MYHAIANTHNAGLPSYIQSILLNVCINGMSPLQPHSCVIVCQSIQMFHHPHTPMPHNDAERIPPDPGGELEPKLFT